MKFVIFLKSSLLFESFYCLFCFINKTLRLINLKTRTAMNAKILVLAVCVETIIYLLLYNLRDPTFKRRKIPAAMKILSLMESKFNLFFEFFLRKYTFPWYLDKLIFLTFSFKSLIEAVSRRCYVKKRVLTNFEKFSGKHLCQSLFFNKVAGSACGKKSLPQHFMLFL